MYCGQRAVRLKRCAFHIEAELRHLQGKIREHEAGILEARARIVELRGGPETIREAEANAAWAD